MLEFVFMVLNGVHSFAIEILNSVFKTRWLPGFPPFSFDTIASQGFIYLSMCGGSLGKKLQSTP